MAGIVNTNRVEGTTERKLFAKVVDNFHETPTLASRFIGRADEFVGKTKDYTLKVTATGQGEWFSGMPTLNSAATDTTVTVSYTHSNYQHPVVIPIEEAMANQGSAQTIPLIAFKTEEASNELAADLGSAIYGTGSGDLPLGLGALVDDGTSVATIGGQSRQTYPALNAVKLAATGGNLTLQRLAVLYDSITNGSRGGNESPSVIATTPEIFSLYEQLLHPSVRMNIDADGYAKLPIRGSQIVREAQMMNAGGFNVLAYRGVALLADSYCTAGSLFMLNEHYTKWIGRTIVPSEFAGQLEKIDLGKAKTIEGQEMMPSNNAGIFRTKMLFHPDQPGAISRVYLFGQLVGFNFRRSGVLTGITKI